MSAPTGDDVQTYLNRPLDALMDELALYHEQAVEGLDAFRFCPTVGS
jgi:hypothetical protein